MNDKSHGSDEDDDESNPFLIDDGGDDDSPPPAGAILVVEEPETPDTTMAPTGEPTHVIEPMNQPVTA